MLENIFGALANVWLQSGIVAVCGLTAARCVRSRGATWSAAVLRATWIGVAFCLVLSLASFSSLSQRALWKVSLPAVSSASISSTSVSSEDVSSSTSNEPTFPNSTITSTDDLSSPSQTSSTRSAPLNANDTLAMPLASDATTRAPSRPAFSLVNVLLTFWSAGSAFLLLMFGVCVWNMRRVVRTSTRIEDETWRASLRELCAQMKLREPRLLKNERAQSPFLTGLLRPCIVLPRGDFAASSRFVLLHELTHLQRRDLWWNLAARLLCAVLWTQPALWILQRACERVGEEVCDEAVVQQSQSPQQYAQCLLDLAESWQPARVERLIGAGVVPLRSALARRLQNILQFSRRSSMAISRRARCAIGVLTLAVVAASLSLVAVQTEASQDAPKNMTSSTRVDLSTPESAVRSFVSALNRRDAESAVRCIEGGAILNPLLRDNFIIFSGPRKIISLKSRKLGNSAEVQIQARVGKADSPEALSNRRELANLRLIQRDGTWKIARPFLNHLSNDQNFLQLQIDQLAPPYRERLQQWSASRGKAVVTGRIVNEDGRPTANDAGSIYSASTLDVLRNVGGGAYSARANLPARVHNLFLQQFKTDARGQFRISGLTTSRYKIDWNKNINGFHPTKQSTWVQSQDVEVVAREGSSTRAPDVVLTKGGLISVRVVDTAGKGLPFVQWSYSKMEVDNQFRVTSGATTDGQGRALVRAIPGTTRVSLRLLPAPNAGRSLIKVGESWYEATSKSGRAVRNQRDPDSTSSVLVNVSKRQQQQVVFKLQRAITPKTATSSTRSSAQSANITGRVVYADGRPAANVRVLLQPFDQVQGSKRYQARYEPQRKAVLRVLSESGGSLSSPKSQQKFLALLQKMGAMDITRTDGSYRLRGIENAEHNVLVDTSDKFIFIPQTAKMPDYVAAAASVRTPKAPSTARVADLVLTKGAIIRGRVLDRVSGKPLENASVYSHGPHRPRSGAAVISTRTDSAGRYQMRIAPGTSYVYISGNETIAPVVHYGDSMPYQKEISVIRSGDNLFFENDWAQVQLDQTSPVNARVGPAGNLFAIPTSAGQTRTFDIKLKRLKTQQLVNGLNVYISADRPQ